MKIKYNLVPIFLAGGLVIMGCAGKRSFTRKLEEQNLSIGLRQPQKGTEKVDDMPKEVKFKENGKESLISVAAIDDDGSTITNFQLPEVRVFAKNKTVSERNGKVYVDFVVSVPRGLVNKDWQVHIKPKITKDVTKDSIFLDDIYVTGERFDSKRREGYEKYEDYMGSIIPDSADFVKNFVDYRKYYMTLDRKSYFADKYRKKVLKGRDDFNNREYRMNRRFLHYNQYPEFMTSKKKGETPTTTLNELTGGNQEDIKYLGLDEDGLFSGMPVNDLIREVSAEYAPRKYRKYINNVADDPDKLMLTQIDSLLWMDFYTRYGDVKSNNERKGKSEEVYEKYVRFPFIRNARLDSIVDKGTDIQYYYSQDVHVDEVNKRMFLTLEGEVTSLDNQVYNIPPSDTITYTITNMLTFVDHAPRFVKKVIERRAFENYSAMIVFPVGKSDFKLQMGNNEAEIKKVENIVKTIDETGEFVVDSIVMVASSSPEGSWSANENLAYRRSRAMGNFFRDRQNEDIELSKLIVPRYRAEDWEKLTALIQNTDTLKNKLAILDIIAREKNADVRENKIRSQFPDDYRIIREVFYPDLRAVNFVFNLHRKGMIKDTIHTDVIDERYAEGVELLENRRYKDALEILLDYDDFNTAICYMSMGYDNQALSILGRQPETADTVYLMAVIFARQKDYSKAIEYYKKAVALDRTKAFRGSLDPEINRLIQAYDLNKSLFEE